MAKTDLGETISAVGQILAYLLGAIVLWQILKAIFGGTWAVEDIILALVIFNLTITFGVGGYLISLNNKISAVHTKIEGHLKYHEGLNHRSRRPSKKSTSTRKR